MSRLEFGFHHGGVRVPRANIIAFVEEPMSTGVLAAL